MSATSPVTDRLGLLEIVGESTFGTSNFDGSNEAYVRCVGAPDRSGLTEDPVVNEAQRQGFYHNDPIITTKNGSIVTRHHLHGPDTSEPTSALSHASPEAGSATGFDMLLGAIASACGNIVSGGYQGSIDLAGNSSTTTVLKEDDLSSFVVGQMVTWGDAGSGDYESGWAKANTAGATDELDLLFAASGAPSGDSLWGSHTIFVKAGQPYHDSDTPASFGLRYTDHGGNQLVGLGCMPTGLSISMNHKEPALMDLTWGLASWSESEDNGAPAAGSYAFPEPEAIVAAELIWGSDAAQDTRILQSLQFDLGLNRVPVMDYNVTNGIAGWATVAVEPTLTFTSYRDAADGFEVDDYSTVTKNPFSIVWGSQPGRRVGLCFTNAVITQFPSPQNGDLITTQVTLAPGEYTGDTGTPGTGNAIDTVCRIAFG